MSSRKNLVALAILLCLTTLVAAVAAGPISILPASIGISSHSTATGGARPSPSQLATIVPLSPGGLASGALVNLDSNSISQTDVTVATSLSTAVMFRAGAILAATAPTVGQALVANPNFKFVGAGATWASPNPVVLDANGNNLYDAGEITVGGITPTVGTVLKSDARIKFIDTAPANAAYDFGETVVIDTGGTNLFATADPLIGPNFFGFQFIINYDPTILVAQQDPCNALGPNCPSIPAALDGAGATALAGGNTGGCPAFGGAVSGGCNWAAAITANTGSMVFQIPSAGRAGVAFTFFSTHAPVFANANNLLANIAFEFIHTGTTTITLSDLKIVDVNSAVIPQYAIGGTRTGAITIRNKPPTARFIVTQIASHPACTAGISGTSWRLVCSPS